MPFRERTKQMMKVEESGKRKSWESTSEKEHLISQKETDHAKVLEVWIRPWQKAGSKRLRRIQMSSSNMMRRIS
jgi:hypothetical protein